MSASQVLVMQSLRRSDLMRSGTPGGRAWDLEDLLGQKFKSGMQSFAPNSTQHRPPKEGGGVATKLRA